MRESQHEQDGRAGRLRSIHPEGVAHGQIPAGAADLCEDMPDQEADGRADRGRHQVV